MTVSYFINQIKDIHANLPGASFVIPNVAAQANSNHQFLLAILDEMLDAFDQIFRN